MRPLAGMWLVVLGYAFLYTGASGFQGVPMSFLASLGWAPVPAATDSSAGIWSQIGGATGLPGAGSIWGFLGNLITGGNSTSSATTAAPPAQTATSVAQGTGMNVV